MNEYKITYTGESEGYRIITDRSEAAAKKFFREDAKKLGLGRITIEGVELLSTNALASKRNERETLETIRQLVADLGPQSYLATAFEGCFEIAEQNIEYDFGDSMKGRVESAERRVKELEAELTKAQHGIDELIQKDDERKAALEKMSAKALSGDDLEDIRQLLTDRVDKADRMADKAASEIVQYADDPSSKEFSKMVDTGHMDVVRESIEDRAGELARREEEIRKSPVYKYPADYARENGELEQYRLSNKANIACTREIDATISKYHDGYSFDPLTPRQRFGTR